MVKRIVEVKSFDPW